ncbi:MAG: AraC family transcriptional regulator, partial [Firmicutes bacterium]|nr:AraC family transcriptional regulator [Bacillota bacterium]
GVVPEGFELIDLPACELVVFQGEPYNDDDFRAQIGFVMESIEKYNPKVYGFSYDPDGYRFQYEPQGYRGYIEGRVIKR